MRIVAFGAVARVGAMIALRAAGDRGSSAGIHERGGNMRIQILIAAAALLAATCFAAEPTPVQRQLAAAESEFAADGLRDGVQKSFIAHFADDGVILRPFPVAAKAWYREHPDRGGKLIWGPQYVAVAAAGDLGLSTGPWRAEGERDGKPVRAHGHFFSVWQHDADGKWRVLFDHGVGHEAPTIDVEKTALIGLPLPAIVAATKTNAGTRDTLAAADDALRQRLRDGAAGAYDAVVRDDTLWLRDGSLPRQARTPEAAGKTCGCGPRAKIAVAASGDFGYTVGGAESARAQGTDVRVWTFDPARGWTLLADVVSAVD
jgi:ketosteroid isomerase-like protein